MGKFLIWFLGFFCPLVLMAQDFWLQTGKPTGGIINKIHIQNDNKIWVTASNSGLFYSKDGGFTWQSVHGNLQTQLKIQDIASSGDDAVFVAATGVWGTFGGLFKSEDEGASWQSVRLGSSLQAGVDPLGCLYTTSHNNFLAHYDGLYKAHPGFGSWQQIFSGRIQDLHIAKNGDIYVATNNQFLSKSRDQGETWRPLGLNQSITNIRSITSSALGQIIAGIVSNGVLASFDYGRTWEHFAQDRFGGYDVSIPVVFAHNDSLLGVISSNGDLFLSNDMGTNWSMTPLFRNNKVNTAAVSTDGALFVGTDNGLFVYSIQTGEIFERSNGLTGSNLVLAEFTDTGKLITASSSDHLYSSENRGRTWRSEKNPFWPNWVSRRKAFRKLIKASDGTLWMGHSLGLMKSVDNGQTWQIITDHRIRNFFGNFAVNSLGHVYVAMNDGERGVFLSKNKGRTWISIKQGLSGQFNWWVHELFVDSRDTIYLSTGSSLFYRTPEDSRWQKIVFNYHILQFTQFLELDGGVVVAGTAKRGIHRFKLGQSYLHRVSGELLNQHILTLAQGPDGRIWAGTINKGIYFSDDNGISWQARNDGLASKRVNDIAFDEEGFIYLATRDNGIVRSREPVGLTTIELPPDEQVGTSAVISGYPNPFNASTNIQFDLPNPGFADIRIFDYLGRVVKKLVAGNRNAGRHIVRWEGKNDDGQNVASGIYFAQMIFDNHRTVQRLLLVK